LGAEGQQLDFRAIGVTVDAQVERQIDAAEASRITPGTRAMLSISCKPRADSMMGSTSW
jgi:hypothetical protein